MTNRDTFHIHGDNIVECARAFDYVVAGLGTSVVGIAGPSASVTCPAYVIELQDRSLLFQFLPGYGESRWNQDVLGFVKRSGGRLREAADAIVTRAEGGQERPIAAIEFCGALPAGNQAWQRQGRAFSFAHAQIPFFYVAELGGFELDEDRGRKAERMPNPAVPFSFFGEKTLAELAQLYDVHTNQITTWRTQLLEGAAGVFGSEGSTEAAEPAIDVKTLHAKIGELTLVNDFLAGALGKAGLLPGAKR